MAQIRKRPKMLETRSFGLLIGLLIFGLFMALGSFTRIPERLETRLLDVHFNLKQLTRRTTVQEGVVREERNPDISPDILILGIDFRTLNTFGRWPFPRYRHANLIDSFTRIQDQNQRELAIFLDLFFIEPDNRAVDDTILLESIRTNDRVFLETVLQITPPPAGSEEELFGRHRVLEQSIGTIRNVNGPWADVPAYFGLQPPLKPYGRVAAGYGHANFLPDDDEVYRRQALVAKVSELMEVIELDDFSVDTPVDRASFERLAWFDADGLPHPVPHPLTPEIVERVRHEIEERSPPRAIDDDRDGKPDRYVHLIRRYRDSFIPSITLALAIEYFGRDLEDIEVVFGKYIRIPGPTVFDVEAGERVPYRLDGRVLDRIEIPISPNGEMLVNFMGMPSDPSPEGHKTFPVRPYSGYASRVPGIDPAEWPETKAVGNRILMVGPFAKGMAEDEKPTPFGLMYGVEIHANALNTILMNRFIRNIPFWADTLILFVLVMTVAFMASRLATLPALALTGTLGIVFFFAVTLLFDTRAYLVNFSSPGIASAFTFLSVIVYRVVTEERDKARIREMFGKYVSPRVVDQILEHPPELGGVDRDISVFFSDIRGFTSLSESMTPQELVNHLNIYFTSVTDIILELDGTLDKYIGDAVMCFWGAPLPQEDHALRACRCALRQMEILRELNEQWPPEKRIRIGIGINTGIMTVGNMGSQGRMSYTVMGDNVNLASRLEGTNKQYMTDIIISEYTYERVKDRIVARELDKIRVKGKQHPVLIYELIDLLDEPGSAPAGSSVLRERISAGV